VPQRSFQKRLQKVLPLTKQKTRVVNPGTFDLPPYDISSQEKAKWGINDDDKVVGLFGPLGSKKNMELLLEALGPKMKKEKNIKILVIGVWNNDGAYRLSLTQFLKNNGLLKYFTVTGMLSLDETREAVRACDILSFLGERTIEDYISEDL